MTKGRTLQDTTLLQARMRELVDRIGSVSDTGKLLGVNKGYISRLRSGAQTNPNDAILKRLKLTRLISYIDGAP